MNELRLVRRDDRSLIVATEAGEEFRLIVDDAVLAELRALSRREPSATKASPREIQALVRAGKSRTEIAEQMGVEEADVERYEEPVLAERRYILDRAQAVPVRSSGSESEEQSFGTAIAERLVALSAQNTQWTSWRDEEVGWMIGLDFTSHDITHRAVWTFDHRKSVLAPITSDATNLSKQGDVGDRLIPKLRAVDDHRSSDRFDSGAFDTDQLVEPANDEVDQPTSGPVAPDHPSTGSIPIIKNRGEDSWRRSVEERAVKTPEPELPDLGQTADLLDALRRRRGEREEAQVDAAANESENVESDSGSANAPIQLPGFQPQEGEEPLLDEPLESDGANERADDSEEHTRRGRNRPQIPSWDDILFGTRSEEDPSN